MWKRWGHDGDVIARAARVAVKMIWGGTAFLLEVIANIIAPNLEGVGTIIHCKWTNII